MVQVRDRQIDGFDAVVLIIRGTSYSTGYNYSQILPLAATGLGILGSIVIARYYARKGRACGAAAQAAYG